MSYTDFIFLPFLAILTGLYWICPANWRSALLLVASYGFYCTWSVRGAALLAAVTVFTFFAGLGIERRRAKQGVAFLAPLTITILVGYLVAFKVALLGPTRGIAGLVMPLGISYTTFKLISYVVEVDWERMRASRRLDEFASYVAFFPQILAGPIQRPASFLGQLPPRPLHPAKALPRIAWGLVKKLVIADNLAGAVNYVYVHLAPHDGVPALHGLPLLAGVYLFPLQLYADFSGLTDIAIGVGLLFGIEGPENFNRPFTAASVTDYWRRWHISLTSWLGDYLFLPLRMLTRTAENVGLAFSIFANTIAIALWHGLSASFLMFGGLHGCFLVFEAFTSRTRRRFFKNHKEWDAVGDWLGRIITFHLVAFALIFFRAPNLTAGFRLVSQLFDGMPSSVILLARMVESVGAKPLMIGLVGYGVLELGEQVRPGRWLDRIPEGPRWVRWSAWSVGTVLVFFGVAMLLAHSGGPRNPFVYEIF